MKSGFQKILFPTDFSDSAELAVPLALKMASAFNAQVTCLHVADDPIDEWICSWSLGPDVASRATNRTAAMNRLRSFSDRHFRGLKSTPRLDVVSGKPDEAIVRYAENNGYDLIVMGGHAYGEAESGLHETNTDRIVRSSSVPVLTVCEPVSDYVRL
jgi:nucleotide-binding universal stress UspA family protein